MFAYELSNHPDEGLVSVCCKVQLVETLIGLRCGRVASHPLARAMERAG